MSGDAIPLVALRPDLERGWPAGARWLTAGGPAAVMLAQPAGSRVAFPLQATDGRLRLRGRVRLTEAAGAGRAAVQLRVAVAERGGERTLWSAKLRRLGGLAVPATARVEAELELGAPAELVLAVEGPEPVRWSELGLELEGPDVKLEPPSPTALPEPGEPGAGHHERPLFSVLTPVHDPPPAILAQTIDSVLGQSFDDWELCLLDDGSSDPAVREMLQRYADADPRVRLHRNDQAGGIAAATNAALALAGGEYVALLDHDDLLAPGALARVAEELREHPGTDMVYSDEELFEEELPTHTFAKPHWSPDLLRSQMYTCHLGVYRRQLAEAVGGFRSDFDGSQDFDFALRVSERSDRVRHIPQVLYRWRVHAGSTAGGGQAKPSAYPAARRALAEHLQRTGTEADVHFGPWQGIYRVVHRLAPSTTVAVGIVGEPGSDQMRDLAAAVEDEERSGVAARIAVGADLAGVAAECAGAEAIVLCEGPVEPLTRLWLARLAAFACQPGVAAVGAKTLAPDGRVEQAGLAIDAGLPLPLLLGSAAIDPGPLGVGVLPANVAAVGGVVAIAGEQLRGLGGLDPEAGGLALPDYCLRGLAAGLRVVTAPDVLVRRTGPAAANDLAALSRFRQRWATAFPGDPYFELGSCWPGVELAPSGASG